MAFSDYKTALVTGASGGMGWASAERLRAKGLTVHALARKADKLQELADRCGVIPHAVDVSDTEAVTALVKDLEIDAFSRERMDFTLKELLEERDGIKDLLK